MVQFHWVYLAVVVYVVYFFGLAIGWQLRGERDAKKQDENQ